MTAADYDEVYSLWHGTEGMGLNSLDDSRGGIEKFLQRNPLTCFIARTEGKLVGAIICGNDGRRGYIYHTAVLSEYRHRGIASALVNSVITALEGEGIAKAALVVFGRNKTGNEFWEKKGFTVRGDLIYRNKTITAAERFDNI
ncbi:MAG: GNAT family N-acetyltransferase [Ruminococcus sp.]|nr:GNAT family N-acetyltransferase [Ruminococcus sp.]